MASTKLICLGLLIAGVCLAQNEQQRVFYIPKPARPAGSQAPLKPHVKLAGLKAKHAGQADWSELVVKDTNSLGKIISASPGSRYERRLYPDSPAWWAVIEGQIRFEIEQPGGQFETFEARKGSYVFVPERMLHSLEVIGSQPAVRFEVTLYQATPVFEKAPQQADAGMTYLPVRLSTGLNPLDVPDPGGKPWPNHVNVYDLAEQNKSKKNWSVPAIRQNRARGNFICGFANAEPELLPSNRGHFHADFAEFWIVMAGKLRWIIEGQEPFVAEEGDIVYAPPATFHMPQFYGREGLNCRLTSSTFPSANHLYDASQQGGE